MRLISAVSGVRIPAPPQFFKVFINFFKGRMNMKKIITLATAGVFLLSLQGASMAQKEEKTPATPPMIEKQIPTPPKTEAPPAPKMETPAASKGSEVKSTGTKVKTKAKKKGKKKKKGRKTKKEKAPVE
jgi:outer membrane biosynthesis protein TonB